MCIATSDVCECNAAACSMLEHSMHARAPWPAYHLLEHAHVRIHSQRAYGHTVWFDSVNQLLLVPQQYTAVYQPRPLRGEESDHHNYKRMLAHLHHGYKPHHPCKLGLTKCIRAPPVLQRLQVLLFGIGLTLQLGTFEVRAGGVVPLCFAPERCYVCQQAGAL